MLKPNRKKISATIKESVAAAQFWSRWGENRAVPILARCAKRQRIYDVSGPDLGQMNFAIL